ncbi:hypothetical protein BGW80DRAFT_1302842 [Lactifluus volemus]|nr:hypothetical protein BGW80DRAFT_1302842 [Lactifluus volemus]
MFDHQSAIQLLWLARSLDLGLGATDSGRGDRWLFRQILCLLLGYHPSRNQTQRMYYGMLCFSSLNFSTTQVMWGVAQCAHFYYMYPVHHTCHCISG